MMRVGERSRSDAPSVATEPLVEVPDAGDDIFRVTTIPRLLLRRAKDTPDQLAFRHKRSGVYQGTTWREYEEQVRSLAAGFIELGLERADRMAIIGDSRPEWAACDLAGQAAGAVPFGIYPTSSIDEVAYVLRDSGATIVVAEDQEHLDKVLQVVDQLDCLRRIVVIDTRALFMYEHDLIVPFDEVLAIGRKSSHSVPDAFEALVEQVTPDDIATLIYTSGTTGRPKGVVHTQQSLLAASSSFVAMYPVLGDREQRSMCHLPLAHVVERTLTVVLPLHTRLVPHYGEDISAVLETLWETNPTFFMSVPRYWEKIASQVVMGIRSSSPLKRWAYSMSMAVGRRHLEYCRAQHRPPLPLRAGNAIAGLLVFRPLRDRVGLRHVELPLTGAAAMPPAVKSLWQVWGVDMQELYGQTESAGLISAGTSPYADAGNVGDSVPHPEWEIRLAEDGEVLYRSPSVFAGYWHDDKATSETIVDGWLLTGDIAERDENGALRLVDRKKDVVVTSGGKTLSPAQIENALRGSPYISEAVIFAEGRKYVTALLEIDYEVVLEWARSEHIALTSYTALIEHPAVIKIVTEAVNDANEMLARVEQVKRFRIMPKELDPESGDTTPTRKVKRRHLYDMFSDLVESMYEKQEVG